MNTSKQNGFTLLEAMIVVAIMGILAAMAIPSFAKSLSRQRTKQAAEDIVNAFNEARIQANTSGKAAKINVDASKHIYTVQYIRRDGSGTPSSLTTNKYTLDSAIDISSNIGSDLTFLPTGKISTVHPPGTPPPPTNVYFRICDSRVSAEEGYSVWINAAGIARVVAGKLSGHTITSANCS